MDIQTCLTNAKLVSSTQIDISYFNNIAPLVFKTPKIYANLQSDVQSLNQVGLLIFNYFNQKDPDDQIVVYEMLRMCLSKSIVDSTALISIIPSGDQPAADLATVLQILIADCQAIQQVLPAVKGK